MTELEQLIEEQQADDTEVVKPEFRGQVPFTDGISNRIGMWQDGEIESFESRPPKGTLLIGTAAYHGTYAGYTRNGCRCKPCTAANTEYRRQRRRNGGS